MSKRFDRPCFRGQLFPESDVVIWRRPVTARGRVFLGGAACHCNMLLSPQDVLTTFQARSARRMEFHVALTHRRNRRISPSRFGRNTTWYQSTTNTMSLLAGLASAGAKNGSTTTAPSLFPPHSGLAVDRRSRLRMTRPIIALLLGVLAVVAIVG